MLKKNPFWLFAMCTLGVCMGVGPVFGVCAQTPSIEVPAAQAAPERITGIYTTVGSPPKTLDRLNTLRRFIHATPLTSSTGAGREIVPPGEMSAKVQRLFYGYEHATTDARVKRLVEGAKKAHELVSDGQEVKTRELATRLLKEAEAELYAVGRDAAGSKALMDLCAQVVRAMFQQNRQKEIPKQAMECLRLVPNGEPDGHIHPPWVIDPIHAAKEALVHKPPARMGISVAGHGQGAPCQVYVNGHLMGQTPLEEVHVPVGSHYVSVLCEEEAKDKALHGAMAKLGYVYRAELKEGSYEQLVLPVGFEGAARFEPEIYLDFDAPEEQARGMLAYFALLHGLYGMEELRVLAIEGSESVRIDRLVWNGGAPKNVASVRIALKQAEYWLSQRQGELHGYLEKGMSMDVRGKSPQSMQAYDYAKVGAERSGAEALAEEASLSDGQSFWQRPGIAGYLLMGTGVVVTGASWALYMDWARIQGYLNDMEVSDSRFEDFTNRRDDRSSQTLMVGAAGLALSAAAMPFWLPPKEQDELMPWWAYASGGLGVGLAAVGAFIWSGHEECANEMCTRLEQKVPLGPFLMMHGAPFLSVPLTYALRPLFSSSTGVSGVSVGASAQAWDVSFIGSF